MCRVRGQRRRCPLPSEPYVKVALHTAQADHSLRASRGPVAHGSLYRLGVRLQTHCWAASNLSLRPAQPIRQLSGSPPGPRQPPFGVGPEALSTGLGIPLAFRRVAFAFWAILFPLRVWAVLPKIVRLTGLEARPHRGRHVPHQLRCGGGGCLLYCATWVPQRAVLKAACLCQTK